MHLGMMNALLGLMDKTGGTVGSFVLGILLNISGYNGALTEQPGSALMMSRMSMSMVPATYLIAVLVPRNYKLDRFFPK